MTDPAPPVAQHMPLDLPRLVMRRAGVVALAVLLLVLVLGLARMGHDMDDEVDAALTLAGMVAGLGELAQSDDTTALAALSTLGTLAAEHPPRHLLLLVEASDGRILLAPPQPAPTAPPMRWLLAMHQRWFSAPDTRHVSWRLMRPVGQPWTVTLSASHESERREAMSNLLGTLALLLAGIVGLLWVMRWNVRLALSPLGRLLAAISGIPGHDVRAVQNLPTMPIHELEAIATALRRLDSDLADAHARRRLLSQQVLSLQDDERARLARELHDEFGQRLTGLRVDAAWLARRLVDQPEAALVVAGMASQCGLIQQDIRALLVRLQPFGVADDSNAGGQSLARLASLLHALVGAWQAPASADITRYQLVLEWADDAALGRAFVTWPDDDRAQQLCLPQALALTLYRISQEALTNVARHAQAHQTTLRLVCRGAQTAGAALQIEWSVTDDGQGLPASPGVQQRGNGLTGIQDRVWAQGSELRFGAGQRGRGLSLSARFDTQFLLPPAPGSKPQPEAPEP